MPSSRGYRDALMGLAPASQDADYLAGYQSGHKRRIRGTNTNVSHQRALADQAIKLRYGCKRHVKPKRCPACGTMNELRTKAGVCLGCKMRGAA